MSLKKEECWNLLDNDTCCVVISHVVQVDFFIVSFIFNIFIVGPQRSMEKDYGLNI